jgi:hypothetical protein
VTPTELAEAQQRCECFESLFNHPGWKLFLADVAGWKDAISVRWQAITPDGLRFEQGRFAGLDQVTNFETLIVQIRNELNETDNDDV